MENIIFLDTETTDVKPESHAIQIAMKEMGKPTQTYYHKPPCPISFSAMAVHHITEEMVADQAPLSGEIADKYNSYLDGKIVVCHNQEFDRNILLNDKVKFGDGICTLKVARKLYPDMEQHKLQYLCYAMGIRVPANAHDAGGDVEVLEALFMKMMEETTIDRMLEISKLPTLLSSFYFGKFRGRKIEDVIKTDCDYIRWLLAQTSLDKDVRYSLNYYMKRK